jgi:pyruvate/2-oxoglutarate/acetoin dehydrogenase E1 component
MTEIGIVREFAVRGAMDEALDQPLARDGGVLAAAELEAAGGSGEVSGPRTFVPLNTRTLPESVRRTRRAVVTCYATTFDGPGAEIAATIGAVPHGRLDGPFEPIGVPLCPLPSASGLQGVSPSMSGITGPVRRATKGRDG